MQPPRMRIETLSFSYKWVALSITTLGVLMVAIDVGVVVLALPSIMTELHSNLVRATWVLMVYIFVGTIFLLAFGRVADIFGRVRLYNLGFALFTAGSALCGFSRTDWELIGSRVIQGIGGALMLVNSWAIVTETFPPNQRGTAMGINVTTFGIGSIVGPVVGGAILAVATWRWVFFINIPVGIVGTLLGYRYLRQTSAGRRGETLDVTGALTFSASLFALLLGLMQSIELSWKSRPVLGLFSLFLIGIVFFLFWERRARFPALDPGLFRNRIFDFSVLAATLQSLAIYSVQFLVVFYFQAVRDESPLSAALHLLPLPLGLALMSPISGYISDKIGARVPATIGLMMQALGAYLLSTTTVNTPYPDIAIGLGLTGLGGGFFFSPNTSAAMGSADSKSLGVAAATLATLRNAGMVTSFALSLAVAAHNIPKELMLKLFLGTSSHLRTATMAGFVDGMRAALHESVIICLIAALVSLVRGKEERDLPQHVT
jgi:EmrB/QacA subfamily drug resistance transporter